MKRVLLHLTLWGVYCLVEFVTNLPHFQGRRELALQTVYYLPLIAGPFYLVAYYLVPNFLWKGQKQAFWALCIALFILLAFFRIEWTHLYYLILKGEDDMWLPLGKISKNLVRDYAVIALGVCLKIINDWDTKDRLAGQLQLEKRHAELQFLQAQIHPHFLFNTLNNLYGLAMVNSPQTADSILKLSGLLDFILYECNEPAIPLQKEYDLIGKYIDLEKLRFGERLDLTFASDTIPPHLHIAPLLLLPFVENAFKHSANVAGEKVFISVYLKVYQDTVTFEVSNSMGNNPKALFPSDHKGIGLQNVKKRLELVYPGKYRLGITDKNDQHLIKLVLDL